MKEVWTKKWKKVLIWVSGYFSILAYAIVGGYVIVKSEDDELKRTAKFAFIITLVFTALSAFLSIFNYCGGMATNYYGSGAYEFYSIANSIVGILRIVVFAAFVVITLILDPDFNPGKPFGFFCKKNEENSAETEEDYDAN